MNGQCHTKFSMTEAHCHVGKILQGKKSKEINNRAQQEIIER